MGSNYTLKLLPPSDKRWVSFINSRPESNIFHHPRWIELLADCYGYQPQVFALFSSNGKISAGLPIMKVESLFTGKRWISLPFSDHCQPLCLNNDSLISLTEEICAFCRQYKNRKILLRWNYPAHPKINLYCHHVLHIIKLYHPHELVIYYDIQRKTRHYIRYAERMQLDIDMGKSNEHIQKYYQLQVLTRQRHGIPVQPKRFFALLRKKILDENLGFVLLASKKGTCIAGLVVLHFNKNLTIKYGASDKKYWDLFPNYLLFWTAIKWAIENGFKTIDMGRCANSNQGLRKFKKSWGANEQPLTYSSVLSEAPSDITCCKLMKMMQKIMRNCPCWLCRLFGEILYKHYP